MKSPVVFGWLARRAEARAKRQKFEAEMASTLARIRAEAQEWQLRIRNAQHLLTGQNWRDSAGKEEFVRQVYEGEVPQYLWYALGETPFTDNDCEAITKLFWKDGGCGFGDIELHHSGSPEIGVGLRVRNVRMFVSDVEVGGHICPLYLTGHGSGTCVRQRPVLFLRLYHVEQ